MIPHQPRSPAGPARVRRLSDAGRRSTVPGGLVKVTVNLSPKTDAALDRLAQGWGVNKTDVINRALRLADVLQGLAVDDHLVVKAGGREVEVHLI